MSVKSAVLAVMTIAVMGLAVYLFIQVRATPAQAGSSHSAARPGPTVRTSSEPVTEQPTATTDKVSPPPPGGQRPPPGEQPRPGVEVDGPPAPAVADEGKLDVKLDTMMEQATKAYDTQDFDQAAAIAGKVLAKDPKSVRMLRIVVSANCIQGDSVVAQQHFDRLPKADRDQMRTRCDRYGVAFKEPSE